MHYSRTEVTQRWIEELRDHGYKSHIEDSNNCVKITRLSRKWRRIFRVVKLNPQKLRVLEVGCGGGKHLVQLASSGAICVGVDGSKAVIERAEAFIREVSIICNSVLNIQLIHADFFDISEERLGNNFDIVFNAGVIEHFLKYEDRLFFLNKKYRLTKDGGYIISIVPNGIHPHREKQKQFGLGGYKIPEVDYTRQLMEEEFKRLNIRKVFILPHNLFSYFLLERTGSISDTLKYLSYLGLQSVPTCLFPARIAFRHAGELIGIAQK